MNRRRAIGVMMARRDALVLSSFGNMYRHSYLLIQPRQEGQNMLEGGLLTRDVASFLCSRNDAREVIRAICGSRGEGRPRQYDNRPTQHRLNSTCSNTSLFTDKMCTSDKSRQPESRAIIEDVLDLTPVPHLGPVPPCLPGSSPHDTNNSGHLHKHQTPLAASRQQGHLWRYCHFPDADGRPMYRQGGLCHPQHALLLCLCR